MSHQLSIVAAISGVTRWLQAKQPSRPLRGLTRLSNLLGRLLPLYQGSVRFVDGTRLSLDSRQSAERWIIYSGNYQPAVTQILRQYTKPGDFCLDVGANLGFYTIKLGRWVLPGGKVAAFEANPSMINRIRQNIALNNFTHVSVIQKAIHNKLGTSSFYIRADPGKSSIHGHRATESDQQITVETLTIDEFIAQSRWDRLDIIKIDIEGNDCNALLGAAQALRCFRPFIVFEYARDTPPETADAAFSLLAALDYGVQVLHANGELAPFDWRTLQKKHVDVICRPNVSKSR